MKFVVFLFLATALSGCYGSNILAIIPMPSRSHAILMERLLINLGNKGHKITLIAAMEPQEPIPGGEVIVVPGIREEMFKLIPKNSDSQNSTGMLAIRKMSPWITFLFAAKMSQTMCEYILSNQDVQDLIASDRKFDLVLGEIMFDEVLLAGFSHKFNAPIVALCPTMPTFYANYLVGNPAPASYIPDIMLGYSDKMSLWERLHNFLFTLATEINHGLILLPKHDGMLKKYFGADTPYIADILKNTSLVLANHHYALGFSRPYLPNIVEVAGVHIKEPKAQAWSDKDLWNSVENAKDGVILFSLGSNTNSSDLPPETIQAILSTFAKLHQLVLWKFEANLENVPDNVKIRKWLPQSDILGHRNLKLFITHGGLLSTTEAISFGTPVVGIPLGGDQHINMNQVVASGWGIKLDLDEINEETFYAAITEVLNNPRYKENAVARSNVFHDTPIKPLESSIWWIEYVLRHKGAHHLKSAAQDLTWYQYYLLDVYAIVGIVVLLNCYISYRMTKCVLKKLCRKCSKTENKDKKD